MKIRRLERHEVGDVWSIDRAEVVEKAYRHENGELVLESRYFDVRGWPPGEQEHYGRSCSIASITAARSTGRSKARH